MRRADGDTNAVDRAGARFRLAAVASLMIGLAAIASAGARGGEPARADRVGQRVVSRSGGLILRDDRGAVTGVGGKDQVYRVERVDGRRLWLRGEGKSLGGWAMADEIVAVEPPDDPSVRRADARPHRGFASMLAAPFRHVESSVSLRHAEAAVKENDYVRALAECDEAIRLDPHRVDAYILRGIIRFMTNRLDDALADLSEAIRLDPRHAPSYANRGFVRMLRGQPDEGLADLDEAIRLRDCPIRGTPGGRAA
jgi:tetratricopeptide (TPR) repeat protein